MNKPKEALKKSIGDNYAHNQKATFFELLSN